MPAFQLGPLVLPTGPLLLLVAWAVATLIAWLQRRQGRVDVGNMLTALLFIGILGARFGYILLHWSAYRGHFLDVLALNDGGYSAVAGLLTGVLVGAIWLWRRPVLRRPLLHSALAGVLIYLLGVGLMGLVKPTMATLPDLLLSRLDGGSQSLSTLRGQPVILNLWASWCGPCRREMPRLVTAANHHHKVRIVLVNEGESASTVAKFLHQAHLSPPEVLLDPRQQLLRLAHSPGLPTTLFLDPSGRVTKVHIGELSAASLQAGINELEVTAGTDRRRR